MRKIPKNVNVGGIKYKVIESDAKVSGPDGQECWGLIQFDRGVIKLSTTLKEDKRWAVFLHEVIHAIDESAGVGLSEDQTDQLAHGLLDFLVRNKLGLT